MGEIRACLDCCSDGHPLPRVRVFFSCWNLGVDCFGRLMMERCNRFVDRDGVNSGQWFHIDWYEIDMEVHG